MTTDYSKAGKTLLLLAVFSFSAFIFFYNLDQGTLIGDDVKHIVCGTEYLRGHFHHHLVHPFLGKYLIGLSVELLGRSDFAAKLPGAFFGFLTGLALFLFVRELTNFYLGLGAMCLWSISPMSTISRSAHLDAFLIFFHVLSLYLFWRFLERREIKYALTSGLAFGLALSSKFAAAILVAIVLPCFLLFHLKDKSFSIGQVAKLALSLLVALCVFLLVYGPALDRLGEILFSKALPFWRDAQSYGLRIVVNQIAYDKPPWWLYLYWYRERYSPALLVLFGSGIAFSLLRRKRIDIFLLLSLLILYSFLFLLSLKFPRYLALTEPSLIILVCLSVFSAHTYFRRWTNLRGAGIITGILFVLFLAHPGFVAVQKILGQGPTGAKAVAEYLEPVITPGATILVWGSPQVLNWYLGTKATILGGPRTESFQDKYQADYIVVEPQVSASWPDDPLASYLRKEKAAYSRYPVGGFELYIKRPLALDVYLAWAKRYEAINNLAKARAEYRKVLDIDPKNEVALKALLYYDFIDNFSQAEIAAPDQPFTHVEPLTFTMPFNGDWRRTLLAHPPSQVSYRLKIPAEPSSLHFSLAMDPESWDWGGDGSTFEIYLKDQTGEHLLFSEHIGNDQKDRRWHDREVSLTLYANREVDIAFVTRPGPKDDFSGDRAGWGDPQVWLSDVAACH